VPLADRGTLAKMPLPRLLLALWQESFSGTLSLSRERKSKRVQLEQGVPVLTQSNVAGESLSEQLAACEQISAEQARQLVEEARRHDGDERSAILALKLLEPAELVQALREQVRRRVVECFAWPDGTWQLERGGGLGEEAQPFRVDPLWILQDGLATHWSAERILGDLEAKLVLRPQPNERFQALARRIERSPDARALVEALDPTKTFGESVYVELSPARLGAAWVLAESGGLDFGEDSASADDAGGHPASGAERSEPEMEFVFESRTAAIRVETDAGGDDADAKVTLSAEAEAVRKEMLDHHERLDELDHYEILGLAPDARDSAVKKAYFGLAKRLHPDAVSRAGLESLHREANEVFAHIAQAYQTLSNPKRRKAYDESRSSTGPAADVNRIAQAETLYRKGEVMLRVGNFAGALDFLRPCVEIWPEEADYQGGLGWALYKKPKPDVAGAREHLEKANALKRDDPVLLFRLGMVLRKQGESERAQELLDRAKSLEKAKR